MENFYSKRSQANLDTCHQDLQVVFNTVLAFFDHTVIEGNRSQARQQDLYRKGLSQIDGIEVKGKHQTDPSEAVDAAAYPIDWNDRERQTLFAGAVLGVAQLLYKQGKISHLIRWGGDWDKDTQVQDNGFDDLVHFEIYKP